MELRKWEEVGYMFFGTYYHNLDAKGRLVIPSKFRQASGTFLYIMQGFEGTLEIYLEHEFTALAEKLNGYSMLNKDARDFARLRLSSVVEVEIDDHGRIAIPKSVLTRYRINREVVIVGVQDHLEVWNLTAWETFTSESSDQLAAIADRLDQR